jgi:hypothetical protein
VVPVGELNPAAGSSNVVTNVANAAQDLPDAANEAVEGTKLGQAILAYDAARSQ